MLLSSNLLYGVSHYFKDNEIHTDYYKTLSKSQINDCKKIVTLYTNVYRLDILDLAKNNSNKQIDFIVNTIKVEEEHTIVQKKSRKNINKRCILSKNKLLPFKIYLNTQNKTIILNRYSDIVVNPDDEVQDLL